MDGVKHGFDKFRVQRNAANNTDRFDQHLYYINSNNPVPSADPDMKKELGHIRMGDGDDVLDSIASGEFPGYIYDKETGERISARPFHKQAHIYGQDGNDRLNLVFSPYRVDDNDGATDDPVGDFVSYGHHAYGGNGSDIFNFTNIDAIDARATINGRIEDFDASRDKLQIEGVDLDLYNLPDNIRLVEYNGQHSDPTKQPQQWLLIENNQGGRVFYALEGARYDTENFNEKDEPHFISQLPDFSKLSDVRYQDPQNYVPYEEYRANPEYAVNELTDSAHGFDALFSAHIHEMLSGGRLGLESVFGNQMSDILESGRAKFGTLYGDGITEQYLLETQGIFQPEDDNTVFGTEGADLINTLGGRDIIYGHQGADLIAGGNSQDMLYGNEGNDKIWGGTGDDKIYGNQGNDTLHGGRGRDEIFGGAGDDLLSGDADSDNFHFAQPSGHDTIVDFQDGVDIIVATGFDIPQAKIEQQGDDTLITIADSSLLLLHTDVSTIKSDDFLFI